MDLTMVKAKIDSGEYKSELEMFNDCMSIFNHAKLVYNEVHQIHQDAIKLQAYLTNRYQTIMGQRKSTSNTTTTNVGDLLADVSSSKSKPSAETKPAVIPKFSDEKEKMLYLYNYINDFQLDERDLAYPFRHLPSRTEYPDYYNIIRKPIDMTKIWHKLNQYGYTSSYVTLDDMCADFAQMFENACVYNEPGSMIYKDALSLQRALFLRRDLMLKTELDRLVVSDDFSAHESLPVEFVGAQVQEIVEQLLDACVTHQDAEGRCLIDSFVELFYLCHRLNDSKPVLTFEIIRQRVRDRVYKRLDAFQDELFELFTHARTLSYFESKPAGSAELAKTRIHRFSQLYKDAYDLQRYFMQKRDELCRNGELLNSPALSYKPHALDTHIASLVGTSDPNFDENDALLVEERYRPLEKSLVSGSTNSTVRVGNFYFINRDIVREGLNPAWTCPSSSRSDSLIVCVLAADATHAVVQVYVRTDDAELVPEEIRRLRRCFAQEVYKTDLYSKIELKRVENELAKSEANCLVVGIRQFVISEPSFENTGRLFILLHLTFNMNKLC